MNQTKPARSRLEQDSGADRRRRGGASQGHDDPADQPGRDRRYLGDAVGAAGRTVVFAYPRTGEPGKIALVDDWDMIPGARGCTPQTCAFRDLFAELKAAGAAHVFGLSTQSNAYQTEMASRLHLPFPVLSDEKLEADPRAEAADHGGRGTDPDQAAGADHRRRAHHATCSIRCFRPTGTPATCWSGWRSR